MTQHFVALTCIVLRGEAYERENRSQSCNMHSFRLLYPRFMGSLIGLKRDIGTKTTIGEM